MSLRGIVNGNSSFGEFVPTPASIALPSPPDFNRHSGDDRKSERGLWRRTDEGGLQMTVKAKSAPQILEERAEPPPPRPFDDQRTFSRMRNTSTGTPDKASQKKETKQHRSSAAAYNSSQIIGIVTV